MELERRTIERLTTTPELHEMLAGWSLDGGKLLLVTQPPAPADSNQGAIWDIRTYHLDDQSVETMVSEVNFETFIISLPAWKP